MRPHRQKTISPLAAEPVVKFIPGPLGSILRESYAAGRYIVGDSVTGHVIKGVGGGNILGVFADYHRKLDFMVYFFAISRPGYLLIGPDCRCRGHKKRPGHRRLPRRIRQAELKAGLFDVLGVVSRKGEQFARPRDRCKKLDRIERR